ncbi:MAG: hypothetical protein HY699_04845 [Deltaproteobacteria bacterium]|nr:hypothetical protein [Deltaproteobacteria bacterium]
MLEASAYLAVRTLSRGDARSLFYWPPVIGAERYAEYLTVRDPRLGWPAPRDLGGQRYDAAGSRPIPAFPHVGEECVSLYGNSFTYSPDVDDAHAWSNVLSQQLGCRVANFGVGGYGTDQAYLRFESNETDQAPVTILGFFVRDVLRNVSQYVQFEFINTPTGFKPRFVVDGDRLQLIQLPRVEAVDFPTFAVAPERFLKHETFLPGSRLGPAVVRFPFTLVLLRLATSERVLARMRGRPNWSDFLTPGHSSQGLEVTRGIMRKFADLCRTRGKRCLVVVFPAPSSYDYERKTGRSLTQHLTYALARDGIDSLDLTPGIARYLGARPYEDLLAQRQGHHNEEGDHVVATLVHEHMVRHGLLSVAAGQ